MRQRVLPQPTGVDSHSTEPILRGADDEPPGPTSKGVYAETPEPTLRGVDGKPPEPTSRVLVAISCTHFKGC